MLKDRIKYLVTPKVRRPFPVFFMHIPKTGGTSLRYKLTLKFADRHVYPNQDTMKKFGNRYPRFEELEDNDFDQMRSARLVIGHYPIELKNSLSEDCKVITFFRDPLQRALSNLFHIYVQSESPKCTLEEVFEHHSRAICNYQTRQMSGHWHGSTVGNEDLQAAIDNLRLVDCVCLAEQFDASLHKIERLLQTNMGKNIVLNARASRLPAISPDLVERIRSHNLLDQTLYDRAKELF